MIGPVVAPVIPASATVLIPPRPGGPLPLAEIEVPDAGSLVAGVVTMDCNGRIADAAVFGALDWPVGTQLSIQICSGLVLVSGNPRGVFRFSKPGQFSMPAAARPRCGLSPGSRLLLTAHQGLLAVHPPWQATQMVAELHARVLGGETR